MQYRLLSMAGMAALLPSALASNYQLVEDYQGSNFFSKMDFFTSSDPTHGYVDYVDQGTAQSAGMISTSGNSVYMGVDHSNIASGSGRRSVRVTSQRSYTHMLVVADIGHNPGGICGTWPAFWTVGPNWPYDGEIDIFEGVNSQNVNYMTLHASQNCAVSSRSAGLLNPYSGDCDAFDNGNAGCSFHETNTLSYGTAMNNNGGAQYAMEWTSQGIKIWWWNRNNPPPGDMFGSNPNPSNWGPPSANWAGSGCNWDSHFQSQQLVFDNTFCGDWGGAVFGSDPQCQNLGSCQSYVQNNPGAFANAYWVINNLKVYQNNGQNNDKRGEDLYNSTIITEADELAETIVAPSKTNEKRAAASQIAPSEVPEPSRHVDAAKAAAAAAAAEAPSKRAMPLKA